MKGFRVWSDYWKRYAFDAELYPDGSLYAMFDDDDGVPHHENTDIVLEFDTGLRDKNGKEIYEGDIVRARWRRAKSARLDTKGEVKFGDGWFYIEDDPDGQDRLGVPIHNCYNIEVIGNIHENPEALKEPLIKDEKIRKAVRAWADGNNIESVHYDAFWTGFRRDNSSITVWEELPLEDNKVYTIEELCGEEEAPEPLEPTFVDLDERVKEKGEE